MILVRNAPIYRVESVSPYFNIVVQMSGLLQYPYEVFCNNITAVFTAFHSYLLPL